MGDDLPPSSRDGNAIPPRLLSALAKDAVRRRVLLTPEEMVPETLLVMVSLRVRPGLGVIGDGGG